MLKNFLDLERGNIVPLKKKIDKKDSIIRWAHGFPADYKYGMETVGYQNIYFELNKEKEIFCERFFNSYNGTKNFRTLETQENLKNFNVISFNINYEPNILNIIEILKKNNIPLFREKRKNFHPLLVAGGYVSTYNPEIISKIFDVIVIGEGEKIVHEIASIVTKNRHDKICAVRELSSIESLYIPSKYKLIVDKNNKIKEFEGNPVKKAIVNNLNFETNFIVSPLTHNPNLGYIEIGRGCNRFCNFCVLNSVFYPKRSRNKKSILTSAKKIRKFTDKVRLVASAENDHREIIDIYDNLLRMGFKIISKSQRADKIDENFIMRLKKAGNESLIIAPEAGSEKLRISINKNISNRDIFESVKKTIKYNFKIFEMYLIIGFPDETIRDVLEISKLVKKIRKMFDENGKSNIKIILDINCHMKKPFTKYQRLPQLSLEEYQDKIKIIRGELKDIMNIEIKEMNLLHMLIETILTRGNRNNIEIFSNLDSQQLDINSIKKRIEKMGYKYCDFLKSLEGEILPWSKVDMELVFK